VIVEGNNILLFVQYISSMHLSSESSETWRSGIIIYYLENHVFELKSHI